MAGTLALYDGEGWRLRTTYVAAAPEAGKQEFFARMDWELALVKAAFPDASYVGVADRAADPWPRLEERTTWQTTDFWHAAEYLNSVSAAMARGEAAVRQWAFGAKIGNGGVGGWMACNLGSRQTPKDLRRLRRSPQGKGDRAGSTNQPC